MERPTIKRIIIFVSIYQQPILPGLPAGHAYQQLRQMAEQLCGQDTEPVDVRYHVVEEAQVGIQVHNEVCRFYAAYGGQPCLLRKRDVNPGQQMHIIENGYVLHIRCMPATVTITEGEWEQWMGNESPAHIR